MIMVCQNVMPTFSDHNPLLAGLNGVTPVRTTQRPPLEAAQRERYVL
jgi:pyruvate kinase